MDLGISGRHAIVCGSSRGLGLACARSLAREGVHVVLNGRDPERLEQAADALRAEHGVEVRTVAGDLDTEEGRSALLATCESPDILVNNNGGPPPGRFADWKREDFLAGIEANLLAPVLLIQAVLPGMQERGFGRVVNITSAMVKAPRAVMGLSTTARTGLTAMTKALAAEVARDNVTLNNLLPERIDTDRQVQMATIQSKLQGISYEEARERIAESLPAGRFGRPEEFGDACAYLCSAQAGFITGQNLSVDGGGYPGLI